MKARTPWALGSPQKSGMYERKYRGHVFFSFWNILTKKWGSMSLTIEDAFASRNTPSWHQHLPWRGLARRPR